MPDQRASERAEVSQVVTVLADERRHAVVSLFGDCSGDSAAIEALSSVLSDRRRGSQDRLAAGFHHVTLPTLAGTGVVTYDPESNVVQYHGHPDTDRLEDVVPATYRKGG